MAVEYKFKPYQPTKLKMASALNDQDKLKKSLESQRANLENRLRAEGIDPGTLGGEFDNRNFIEKALNLKPDQGMLLDFFEVINRPVEAVKAGIVAGVKGEDVLAGAWEGLSGDVVTEGTEVAKLLGIPEPQTGFEKFVLNVGTDIILDPLNLLPAGFFLKKFGKLLSKSKAKMIQQFTGKFLGIVNSIDNVAGTGKYAFKNMDEFDAFVKNAPKDEVAHIAKKFDELSGNGSIFRKGQVTDANKGFKYGNTFEELKARATELEDVVKNLDNLEAQYLDGTLSKADYEAKVNEALPEGFKIPGKGSKKTVNRWYKQDADGNIIYRNEPPRGRGARSWQKESAETFTYRTSVVPEINLYNDTKDIVKSYGSEYDTVLNKTSNRIDDVTIVREVKIGDDTYYVKVMGIEAKNADEFYLQTATMLFKPVTNADGTVSQVINFSDSARATQFPTELQDKLKNILRKEVTINGQKTTLEKALEVVYNNKRGSVNLAEFLDDASAKELKQVLIDMFKFKNDGSSMVYLGSGTLKGKGLFADFNDVIDFMDPKAISIGWTKPGRGAPQFRMLGNISMDFSPKAAGGLSGLEVLISEGKVQLTRDIIENADNLVDVERTARVNLFEYYKDKPGIIGDISKVGAKFISFMKSKFSAYGFLSPELETAARRLKGETAIQYQTRMLRLANLRDSFAKRFPNLSDRYLAELVESGAHIDAATGMIRFADRTIPMEEYIQILISSNDQGLPGILRKFGRGADNRFVADLNDAAGTALGTVDIDYFKIVERNGKKVLEVDLTSEQLKRVLLEVQQNPNFIGKKLNWGMYSQTEGSVLRLSADAENVLRNWEDYENFVNLHHDVQQILAKEGGFYNFLNDAGEINDVYLRHIMTKEAYEYMSKNQPGVLSEWAKPGSNFFKQRRYLGTIDEVNDYLKAIYDLDMEVFDPSAFRAAEDFFKYAFRNIEQGKFMELLLNSKNAYGEGLLRVVDNTRPVRDSLDSSEVMFKSFKEEFSSLYKNLSPKHQEAMEAYFVKAGLTGNQAIVMNRTMYDLIKQSEKAFKDLPSWVKMYDKYLNTWKGLTLVTPGFHLRNLFGNSFNSYAVGMDTISQLKYSRIAMLEIEEFQKAVKILADGGTLTAKQKKIYDVYTEFQRNGLIQSHRGVRDLEQAKEAAELAAAKGTKGVKGAYNTAIRFNFNIAEKMDDFQRYMLYRWALDKTGDSVKAARTVTESLFDYSALTGFEKDVMKRIFPFYTFMKNNFIFQAKNILRNPQQYARVGRAYNYYLEDIAGYGPDDLPDYATENMWIPLPTMITKNDKEGIAFLKANLPLSDFIELVENPFKKGAISLTVPLKLPIELGIGRDLFTGAPITDFPGQTSVMEPGTGALAGIRNERGQVAIGKTPLMQKIMNDLGFRTPLNFATVGVDLVDTLTGYQGPQSGLIDFLERTGVAGAQDLEKLEITALYQDLEHLRELKKLYEQETNNQLPILPR